MGYSSDCFRCTSSIASRTAFNISHCLEIARPQPLTNLDDRILNHEATINAETSYLDRFRISSKNRGWVFIQSNWLSLAAIG
jgi:hypothetical protein